MPPSKRVTASRCSHGSVSLAEIDDALLGPKALSTGALRNKSAMTAVSRGNETDRRIVADSCGRERSVGNERVVLSGDQEDGKADLRGDALGAGMLGVVLSVTVAELWRGDDIIELAYGSNGDKPVERVAVRKHLLLAGVAIHQTGNKVAFVEKIFFAF